MCIGLLFVECSGLLKKVKDLFKMMVCVMHNYNQAVLWLFQSLLIEKKLKGFLENF